MHSSTSFFRLCRDRLKPLNWSPRRLKGGVCALVLLISTMAAAAGQSSDGARLYATRPEAHADARNAGQVSDSKAAPVTDSAAIMRQAKLIYVRKKTVYIEATELENELRKRPEFQRWGLAITRNEADADLILEVNRKVFTRFVYSVLDPRTNIVVASGKLSSLGGTLSTKIAKRFIEQMRRVRS
jgi:hypothetical protein